ncbi:MFS transporter [Neobacillus mesonae]|uniref:MFS transporter n=1 Tax=Neobacillus mesonae TaxID=1193713 RepID=A0A3T0HYZ4_9BACI|nr:MFS transporter [Neobacillus mesonae]AZU62351.1 MFS transporter [Neobacillus mesonae]
MLANNYRYKVMFMMLMLAIINYIDRGAISYAQAEIIKEFGFDNVGWGMVLGYFGYGYIFGSLFGGILADKKGPKFVFTLVGIGWSIFVILTAFAGEIGLSLFGGSALTGFAVIRIFFGLAEGPTFSTINKANANWAAPKERGLAVGLGILGTPLGALLTAPIIVGILSITNWRVMFIGLGIFGIVWVLLFRRMFSNMPEENPSVSKAELEQIRSRAHLLPGEKVVGDSKKEIKWYEFFKHRALVFNAISYFSYMYVNFLLLTWTPKYLQDEFNFQLSSLWYLGMIPWVGACITVLLGGKLSDFLRRKTGKLRIARSYFTIVCLALTAACFLIIPTVNSPVAVIALMTIGNAFNSLPNTVYWSIILDIEPDKAGTYGGMTHFVANFATIIAPTLTGFLVTYYGYSSMFIAAAVAVIIGMMTMFFVNPDKSISKLSIVNRQVV